jgi:hypothetical protein
MANRPTPLPLRLAAWRRLWDELLATPPPPPPPPIPLPLRTPRPNGKAAAQ